MVLPILVYCARLGALCMRFGFNFLWFFVVLENSLSTVLVFYFTFIIPGGRDIVQVVKTVQIDLQMFRFTEPVSNLESVLKQSCTTLTRCKKAM